MTVCSSFAPPEERRPAETPFNKRGVSGMVRQHAWRDRGQQPPLDSPMIGHNAMASPAKSIQLDELVVGDSRHILKTLPPEFVHLILSDIPYGIGAEDWDILHDNTNSALAGSSPAQERAGAIF